MENVMSRYESLVQFLDETGRAEVRLTFGEIERALGFPLPPSARRHQAWWANSDSHRQALVWMAGGWRTAQVDLATEKVVFERRDRKQSTAPASAAPNMIPVARTALSTGARRAIADLVAERGLDEADALVALLDEAVASRRAERLRGFATGSAHPGDSASMIREDRDAR
jgi:hypothetical protein